jgi:hypothetical protein
MSPTVMNDRGEGVSNYDGRVTVAELLRREGMTQENPVVAAEPASGWTGYDDYVDETPTDLIPVAEILRREGGQETRFFPHSGAVEPAAGPYLREDEREPVTELYGREDGLENVVGLYGHEQAGGFAAHDEPTQYAGYEDEHEQVNWFQRQVEQAYGEDDAAGYSGDEEPAERYADDEGDDPADEEFTRLYAHDEDDHRDGEVAELLPRLGTGDRRRAGKISAVAAGVVALAGLAVAAFGAGHSANDTVPPLAGGLGGGPVDPTTSSTDPSLLPNGPFSASAAVPGASVPEGSASTSGAARPGASGLTGGKTSASPVPGSQTTTDRAVPPSSSSSSAGSTSSVPSSSTSPSPSSSPSSTTQNQGPRKSAPPTSTSDSGSIGGILPGVGDVVGGLGGAVGGLLG